MNCHFVTESLTKPWADKSGMVRFFDFSTRQFGREHIKKLFAQKDTNSFEIEQKISEYIERPIGEYKLKLVGKFGAELVKADAAAEVTEWKVYRALYLYFVIQVQRFLKAKGIQGKSLDLDSLLMKGEDYLNQFALAEQVENKVGWVQIPRETYMSVCEVGFFQFPVRDKGCVTGYTTGYAVPITPWVALFRISRTADIDSLFEDRMQLGACSLGLNENARRVILPDRLYSRDSESLIRDDLLRMRKTSVRVVRKIEKVRRLTISAYQSIGIQVTPKEPLGLPRRKKK
jgi:hypothetical protein